jgi:hypothetical protein
MQSTLSEAINEATFRRGFNFEGEKTLHQAMYEAGYHDRSIPWSDVTPNDVLGGQGRGSTDHAGSVAFRASCRFNREDYFRASNTKHDEWATRRLIIDETLSRDGRFLVRCTSNRNCWKMKTYDQLHKKIQTRLWEKDKSPPTVADGAVDITPAAAIVNPDTYWDEDHPSTVADNVVDASSTSAMVNLDRNSSLDQDRLFLDQDRVFLDTSDVNEYIDIFKLDEAAWSNLLSLDVSHFCTE